MTNDEYANDGYANDEYANAASRLTIHVPRITQESMKTRNKCILVIGPESSGSKLIARTVAQALDIAGFEEWNGTGWADRGGDKVCHRSLPYAIPPVWPDVDSWIMENKGQYDIYFILCTRDLTLSETSRISRWGKTPGQVALESEHAREIMHSVMRGRQPRFVWSYETFMFLGKAYLDDLYAFLGVSSGFMPELKDGNAARLAGN